MRVVPDLSHHTSMSSEINCERNPNSSPYSSIVIVLLGKPRRCRYIGQNIILHNCKITLKPDVCLACIVNTIVCAELLIFQQHYAARDKDE